jgi:hypothetical protein
VYRLPRQPNSVMSITLRGPGGFEPLPGRRRKSSAQSEIQRAQSAHGDPEPRAQGGGVIGSSAICLPCTRGPYPARPCPGDLGNLPHLSRGAPYAGAHTHPPVGRSPAQGLRIQAPIPLFQLLASPGAVCSAHLGHISLVSAERKPMHLIASLRTTESVGVLCNTQADSAGQSESQRTQLQRPLISSPARKGSP